MKTVFLFIFILIFATGCSDFMKDFLTIDKDKGELNQPSQPLPEKAIGIEIQTHTGSTRFTGTASSGWAKTQHYQSRAVGSGTAMTMSVSAQVGGEQ